MILIYQQFSVNNKNPFITPDNRIFRAQNSHKSKPKTEPDNGVSRMDL